MNKYFDFIERFPFGNLVFGLVGLLVHLILAATMFPQVSEPWHSVSMLLGGFWGIHIGLSSIILSKRA